MKGRSQKETITTGYRQEKMARGGLVAFGVGGLRLLTFMMTKRGDKSSSCCGGKGVTTVYPVSD